MPVSPRGPGQVGEMSKSYWIFISEQVKAVGPAESFTAILCNSSNKYFHDERSHDTTNDEPNPVDLHNHLCHLSVS